MATAEGYNPLYSLHTDVESEDGYVDILTPKLSHSNTNDMATAEGRIPNPLYAAGMMAPLLGLFFLLFV